MLLATINAIHTTVFVRRHEKQIYTHVIYLHSEVTMHMLNSSYGTKVKQCVSDTIVYHIPPS